LVILGAAQTKSSGTRTGELTAMFDAPLPEMLTVMCVCNKANFDQEDQKSKKDPMAPKFSTATNP
jgi:hypothetical protein